MASEWSEPRGLRWKLVEWYCRRTFGSVLAPASVMAHHPRVMKAHLAYERAVQRWDEVDSGLKHLAVMAVAAKVGCPWCMDFSYWASEDRGVPLEKARAVPAWRGASDFTELERLVLEYAEAMTETPPSVDDALVERLRRHLTEAQVVELTQVVALENLRSRTNRAYGLVSQGFSDRCPLAPDGVRPAA